MFANPISTTALLGLGRMGAAIGDRLLAGEVPLVVWNRTPRRTDALTGAGAQAVSDPAEAVAAADVVVTSLADDDALVDLLVDRNIIAAMAGAALVECSTVGLGASQRVAAACSNHDVEYVRAPISGNPEVVRSGTATMLVSAPHSAIDRCRPVLERIAGQIKVLGTGDEARVVKLAINLVLAGTAELLGEATALAEACGVDRAVLLDALNDSVVGSAFTRYKTGPLVARDYTATFSTADLRKDVRLAVLEATAAGATLPVGQLVDELLTAAITAGYGDRDFISLLLALQHASGLPIDLPD